VEWASATVATWPDDVLEAPFDIDAAREAVALAQSIESMIHVASGHGDSSR
jgi:hypothetical protein